MRASEHDSTVFQPSQLRLRVEDLGFADERSEHILVPARAGGQLSDVLPIDTLLVRDLSKCLLGEVAIESEKTNEVNNNLALIQKLREPFS